MKAFLAALTAVIVLGLAGTGQAGSEFYVAGGYDYFSDGLNGGDIDVGWQFNTYYALEAGLTVGTTRITSGYGYTTAVAVAELTADVYGFLPLGRNSPLSLFGTVGLASIGVAAGDSSYVASASGAGARVGGGIDWRLSRDLHLRTTGRYQFISVAGLTGGDATANLQVVYYF